MEPPVNQNRRGLFRIPLIPAEQRIPPHQQFPAGADPNLGVHGRAADVRKIDFFSTFAGNHARFGNHKSRT